MSKKREPEDIAAMIGRMIEALGRKVRDQDPDQLTHLFELRRQLDTVTGQTVRHMHEHQEMTWAAIASAAGTSRQAAWERWSTKPAATS